MLVFEDFTYEFGTTTTGGKWKKKKQTLIWTNLTSQKRKKNWKIGRFKVFAKIVALQCEKYYIFRVHDIYVG